MYYLSLSNNGNSYVIYAKSNDGISWTRQFSHPVLYPGSPGTWNSWEVQADYILKEDNSYKMYFTGWSDNYGNWNIGIATSVGGIIWEKMPNPVLYSSVGWEYQIHVSSVIKFNGTYFLYYSGRNFPDFKIGVATSTDGINWTKYAGNPILTSTKLWKGNGIYYPSVVIKNFEFKMVYMNFTGSGFGFAYSVDGLSWEKDNSNPFFSIDNISNDWANTKIAYPNLIKLPSEQRIYYSGQNNGEPSKIGFMRKY